MYITVKTIKRNLGFKGVEISDILIGFPLLTICILLFSLSRYKLLALVLFMITFFLLLPISVSKKNRMYKVLLLILGYTFRIKNYTYSKTNLQKRSVITIDDFKRKST